MDDSSPRDLTCYCCGGPAVRWGYVDTILNVPWCDECWSEFLAKFSITSLLPRC